MDIVRLYLINISTTSVITCEDYMNISCLCHLEVERLVVVCHLPVGVMAAKQETTVREHVNQPTNRVILVTVGIF